MNIPQKITRLPGLDAARTLAILGMFAAHIFSLTEVTGTNGIVPTFTGAVASGRSSVLFMVLAGVSFSLMYASLHNKGLGRPKILSILARRALIIAALGMAIGPTNEQVANILVHYGLLFLVLLCAVQLPHKLLWTLAVLWLVVMPVVWRPLVSTLETESLGHNPTFTDLIHPLLLLKDLTITGYYPLMIWVGYGLLGLAIGRIRLDKRSTQLKMVAAGSVVAIMSLGLGWWQTNRLLPQLLSATTANSQEVGALVVAGRLPGLSLDSFIDQAGYLWLPTAHSNSLIFTAHAAGCAVALLGLMLMLTPALGAIGRVIAGAGRAPLTLYVTHLLLLPFLKLHFDQTTTWWILFLGVLGVGIWLSKSTASGPLETGVKYLSGARDTN